MKTIERTIRIMAPFLMATAITIFGLGCFLGLTGLVISGLLWLALCLIRCKREEKTLEKKFGDEYIRYKNMTPRFIPDFERMFNGKKISKLET